MNKPGYTTTEFWSTLIAQVLALIVLVRPSVIVQTGNAAPLVQAFAVLAAAVGSAAYSHSRAKVKVAAGSAVVVAPGPATNLHTEPLVERNAS